MHHIAEARALGEAARHAKVATQMGNQGSGTGNHQALAEWLEAGAVGKLLEVHAWHIFANRFGGSMPKPKPEPVPKGLDWDAWLGPARARPFATVYRPWHGWDDFGTGSLGGWAPHSMDARTARISPQRRPHYPPTERAAILQLRASRGWSLEQTAKIFLVTAETVSSWIRRIDEAGSDALVKISEPVNKFPDYVRYLVQRLKVLCPLCFAPSAGQGAARRAD